MYVKKTLTDATLLKNMSSQSHSIVSNGLHFFLNSPLKHKSISILYLKIGDMIYSLFKSNFCSLAEGRKSVAPIRTVWKTF
jgi:hypothetical protein